MNEKNGHIDPRLRAIYSNFSGAYLHIVERRERERKKEKGKSERRSWYIFSFIG